MIFLDVNVVIYAQGKPHPYKARCQRLVRRLVQGEIELAINAEILQEVIYFYGRRNRLEVGIQTYKVLTEFVREVFPVTRLTTDLALDLLMQYPPLSFRDAIHAATMREMGVQEIYSFDRHFDLVEGVKRIEP